MHVICKLRYIYIYIYIYTHIYTGKPPLGSRNQCVTGQQSFITTDYFYPNPKPNTIPARYTHPCRHTLSVTYPAPCPKNTDDHITYTIAIAQANNETEANTKNTHKEETSTKPHAKTRTETKTHDDKRTTCKNKD